MKRTFVGALLLLTLYSSAAFANAQGCSQCRETVGQTNPQTQQAYRRGIIVLVLAGSLVFAGTVLTLRRFR